MKKLLLALAVVLTTPAFASTTTCKIVGVADGDTATCLTSAKKQIKIRFDQIDAPEKNQDFGQASKQALSNLIFGKTVEVKIKETDRYGRSVGEVFYNGQNINKQMVSMGMAWAYREYNKDPQYITLEATARTQRKGLWSQPNPVYPSNFRRAQKNSGSKSTSSSSPKQTQGKSYNEVFNKSSGGGSCGKRTCKQMTSCQEAKYHLNVCGVASLDRDKDGVPCESLCK